MPADTRIFRPWWRNIPNALSLARLGAGGVLLGAAVFRSVRLFEWVLLSCLLSDAADGVAARWLHAESRLGAWLDSVADVATMFFGLAGVLVFQQAFVARHSTGLLLVAGLYFAEVGAALWRYGRVSSFHTLLGRVAAAAGGVFVMWLFLIGYQDLLYRGTVVVYVVALTEEMLLIYLLPEWRSDVRGVRWVRRAQVEANEVCVESEAA